MTPKERVKLNVYKNLLEDEKKKNKKYAMMGASMFVIGIFSDGIYEVALNKTTENNNPLEVVAMAEVEEIEILKEIEANKTKSRTKATATDNDIAWDLFLEGKIVENKSLDLSTEDLFVADFGI